LGEYQTAHDIYRYCQLLVEYVHDSLDLNIVQPLIVMACAALHYYNFFEAVKIASGYLMIATTTCELLDATECEVSVVSPIESKSVRASEY